jgi:hypothetical protein
MSNSTNSGVLKLVNTPASAQSFVVSQTSKPSAVEQLKTPIYNIADIRRKAYDTLKTFVAFQDMCQLTLPSNKQFLASPASRIAIWNKPSAVLNLDFYVGLSNSNGLLAPLQPREGNLNFLIEKYSKQLDIANQIEAGNGSLMYTGDTFFKDAFQRGSKTNQLVSQMIYGKTKVARALKGFKFVSNLFEPAITNNPLSKKYINQKLPRFQSSSSSYIQGIIQVLNDRIMSSLDARKRHGTAIPDSILDTCFRTPSSLSKSAYNPLDNSTLNLGKNLFDMNDGLVACGPLAYSDIEKWNQAFNSFYTTAPMNPKLWNINSYQIPTAEEIDRAIPSLDYVWALSQHFLYYSPSLAAPSPVVKQDELGLAQTLTTLDVQYALYSDNHATRLIETCSDAEGKGMQTCTTHFPYIRTYENPSLCSWMSTDDIFKLYTKASAGDSLVDGSSIDSLGQKVVNGVMYHRFANQNMYPVGSDTTLEMLTDESKLSTALVSVPSSTVDGKSLELGGEFAVNIFEKNLKIFIESQPDNVRIDAVNLVADDNECFMDARLPACFYEYNDAGKAVQLPTSIDHAMAYSTGSNVVLLCRTIVNDASTSRLVLNNGRNRASQAECDQFRDMINFNVNFSLNTGDEFAQDIKFNRNHPITPKRLIFDALYTLLSDQMRKHVKIIRDNGNRDKRWAKIREYSDPYYDRIIKSGLLNLDKNKVFKTPYTSYKTKGFLNLLRGVLYEPDSLGYGKNPVAAPVLGSKDFLTHRRASPVGNDYTDPLVDSFFYYNTSGFKPYSAVTPFPKPQDIYLTRGDGPISDSDKSDTVSRSEEGFGAKVSTGSRSAYRRERDLRKVLLSKSLWSSSDRALSFNENLDAVIPFLANGLKAYNSVKASSRLAQYEPNANFGSCYARCFKPYIDKDEALETLYFYHKAAVGNGAPFGRMLDNGELPANVQASITSKPLMLNPYSCNPIKGLELDLQNGFQRIKSYETKYMLRKEYYAMRFMALLGSYMSRCLDEKGLALNVDSTGLVVYEQAFARLGQLFLSEFKSNKNQEAVAYFDAIINRSSAGQYAQGEGFLKLCFFEAKPLEVLLNSVSSLSAYSFMYADSLTTNIAKCLRNKDGKNEGELFINDRSDPRKIGLLQFIISNELNLYVSYGADIPEEYKQRAYRYVCTLDQVQRENLIARCQADLQAIAMVYTTMITPGMKLNPDIKSYFCNLKKNKKARGIPFLPFTDPNVLTTYLASTHAAAGMNLLQKINELDCEGDAFSQAEIDAVNAGNASDSDGQGSRRSGSAIAMSDKLDAEGRPRLLMLGAGLAGLSLVSYLGYNFYKKKRNRRMK